MILTLAEVSSLVGGRLAGDGAIKIQGVGSIEEAAAGDLAALDSDKLVREARQCKASAILVSPKLCNDLKGPHVVVDQPQLALNKVIERLGLKPGRPAPLVHSTAIVHPKARFGRDCIVGPYVVVGAGAVIGDGCWLQPHVVVEEGAQIGRRCTLRAHALICSPVKTGDDVVIGASSVIGSEGFGFDVGPLGGVRLHHIGLVEIGDRVEIGSCVTIDRARFGVTRIESDVKLDSHVHVGHGCTIGQGSLIAAQTGLAGSSHLGKGCQIGGQVGFAGHLHIADRTSIAARSGVRKSIETSGGKFFGLFAKDHLTALRELAALERLPDALKELKDLKNALQELKKQAETDSRAAGS